MLVLLTRALEEAKRSAAALAAHGHKAVLSPVIEMQPTGALWPTGLFNGVLATSARAFDLLTTAPDWPLPESRRLIPLFLVGMQTGQAARERGFDGPALTLPDAKTLAAEMNARCTEPRHFIYLAGRDRKSDLEDSLRDAGHRIEITEVYAAQPAEALTDAASSLIASGEIRLVFHYSRRSTEIFLGLTQDAGFDLTRLNHLCISADAAAPLLDHDIASVLVAKTPDEPAMFALLDALAALPKPPL
ncbi:MAG TPA: uroporphyrinogen-III synthase [Methylocella sp.]|nr:uroporphyrinogen-III synthase [Methylocella sp.]